MYILMKNYLIAGVVVIVLVGGGIYLYSMKKNNLGLPAQNQQVSPITNTGVQPTIQPENVSAHNEITLSLSNPVDKTTVKVPSVTVQGKTAPNADVSINGVSTKANALGVFSLPVQLDEGDNVIDVAANDENGNAAEQEITVTYANPAL